MDFYKTISNPAEGEYKEKGSKFICYVFPVHTASEIENSLESIKKMHPKARHYCYAWKLGTDGNQYRSNDDGEPSGTAGKPILNQLLSFELTHVLAVVVRYFGGTLLGTTGLIRAYKEATIDALNHTEIIEKIIDVRFTITFEYHWMSDVMNALKKLNVEILEQEFNEGGRVVCSIIKSQSPYFINNFKAHVLKKTVEEVSLIENIEGITFV
jgi:uncharacterized YigZ family protein